MVVSVTITGNKQILNRVAKLGGKLKDMSDAFEKIGSDVAQYYAEEAFASQGTVFKARWEPLSARTKRYKKKHYPTFVNQPLVRRDSSDSMKNSFDYTVKPNQVVIGNSAPYFKYHQSTLDRTVIPRRQMMGINKPVQRIVKHYIKENIEQKLRKG